MKKLIGLIALSSFFLAGCYDNVVFKDAKIPTVMGIENDDDGDGFHSLFIMHTPIGTSQGIQEAATEIISSDGDDFLELFTNVEQKASGGVDLSKLYVSVLDDDYAKTHFEEFINQLTFAQRTSSTGQIVFVDGKPSDALAIRDDMVPLVDDYVTELIRSGIGQNFIPDTNIAKVHRIMLDEGQDNIIPTFEVSKQKDLWRTLGVSLMNGTENTGTTLSPEKTELLMAFMGDVGKTYWNIESGDLEGDGILVKEVRLDKTFGEIDENGVLQVDLDLELGVLYRSFNGTTIAKLNGEGSEQEEILSEMYTELANEVFGTLYKANCDALGIGRDLIAYHPETWKQLDEKNYYTSVSINPNVQVNVLKTN